MLSRQQAAVLAFGRRATAPPPLAVLMQDAVGLISEVLQTDLCGIGEVGASGDAVRMRISPIDGEGKPAEVVTKALPLVRNSPAARSMAAQVIETGHPVVVSNFSSDPRFSDDWLEQLGVASGVAVPLSLDGRVFGLLGAYCTRIRTFSQGDVRFAETMAYLLSASIGRLQVEVELKRVSKEAKDTARQLEELRRNVESQATQPASSAADPIERIAETRRSDRPAAGDEQSPRPFQPVPLCPKAEMRSSPRREYRYRQWIAPMYGGIIPARKDFIDVECVDISAGGIAFYFERPPDFDSLVLMLGLPPNESFFTAKVVRLVKTAKDQTSRYLVGCRFTGRIQV